MKLISFSRLGRCGFGAVIDAGIIDLTEKFGPEICSIKRAIELELIPQIEGYADSRAADFGLSDVTLLPTIPDPTKILCVGLNYAKHQAETGRPDVGHPTIFTRFADSQVGHLQALIKPALSLIHI